MVSIHVENYCYKCGEDIKLISKEDKEGFIIFMYKCNKCDHEQQLELYYEIDSRPLSLRIGNNNMNLYNKRILEYKLVKKVKKLISEYSKIYK